MAVAARHLGWRLVEVVREARDWSCAAVAQGIRRFWGRAAERPQWAQFARRLRTTLSIVNG